MDIPPTLEYETPSPTVRRPPSKMVRWGVALISGAAAGVLVPFSPPSVGFAMLASFVVGALSAAFAPGRRIRYALLGNATTLAMICLLLAIHVGRVAFTISLDECLNVGAVMVGVLILPGLVGAGLIKSFDRVYRVLRTKSR